MELTEKETAFMRGLTLEPEWTQMFTDFFDDTVKIGDVLTVTYLNAGTGNHAIELVESLGAKTQIFPVCETADLAEHARLKAEVSKTDIDFATTKPIGESDFVITDATLQDPEEIAGLAQTSAKASSGGVAMFLSTSGSFGEIFSFLWEVLMELGIEGKDDEIERLIIGQKKIDDVEQMFRDLALRKIKSHQKVFNFDFENGKEFAESLLMKSFFFPKWTAFLDQKDKERVIEKLAQKIDDESEGLSFRLTVKATIVEGKH